MENSISEMWGGGRTQAKGPPLGAGSLTRHERHDPNRIWGARESFCRVNAGGNGSAMTQPFSPSMDPDLQ